MLPMIGAGRQTSRWRTGGGPHMAMLVVALLIAAALMFIATRWPAQPIADVEREPDAPTAPADQPDSVPIIIGQESPLDTVDLEQSPAVVDVTNDAALVELEAPGLIHGFCMCHPFGFMQALRAAALADPEVAKSTDRGIYRFYPGSGTRQRGAGAPLEAGPAR